MIRIGGEQSGVSFDKCELMRQAEPPQNPTDVMYR